MTRRDEILAEITREENRLARLRSEVKQAGDSLKTLQAELESLSIPFMASILGIDVVVEKLDMDSRDNIVAVCRTKYGRQAVRLLDLRLPHPAPAGAEWIEAYRLWYNRG